MLDEPTNTLDVKEARRLRKIVREQNEDYQKTIIYCTHLMSEAEELCNRVAIIDQGSIIALDDPQNLKNELQENDVLNIEGTIPDHVPSTLSSLPGILSAKILVRQVNNGKSKEIPYLSVTCKDSHESLPKIITSLTTDGAISHESLPKIITSLTTDGAIIRNIDKAETTLEDVFVEKTGRSLMDDTRQAIKAK
jgi:ABC-2 type transport system ATP-binding protein